jgi:hypothetical protein
VIKSFIFDELKEKIDEILKRRALGANKRKNLTQEEIRGSNIEALARWKREGAGSISLQ